MCSARSHRPPPGLGALVPAEHLKHKCQIIMYILWGGTRAALNCFYRGQSTVWDKIRKERTVSQTKAKNGSDGGGPVKDNFPKQNEEPLRVVSTRRVMVRRGSQNRKVQGVKEVQLAARQAPDWEGLRHTGTVSCGDPGPRREGRVSFMSLPLPTTNQASSKSKGLSPKACP